MHSIIPGINHVASRVLSGYYAVINCEDCLLFVSRRAVTTNSRARKIWVLSYPGHNEDIIIPPKSMAACDLDMYSSGEE